MRREKKKRWMERMNESVSDRKIFSLYGNMKVGERNWRKLLRERGEERGREKHTSRRHGRVREERRKERRGDMITKETARKKIQPGRKRQSVWSRQRGERARGKKGSGRTERHRERDRETRG